jgi:chromosome partitioning protein
VLATELALSGANVTVIDADPNRPGARWGRLPGRPENLTVIEDVTERSIIATIDREAALVSFVVVDLEGTASRMRPYAMSQADLVIIPSRGSTLDAVEAVETVETIREVAATGLPSRAWGCEPCQPYPPIRTQRPQPEPM